MFFSSKVLFPDFESSESRSNLLLFMRNSDTVLSSGHRHIAENIECRCVYQRRHSWVVFCTWVYPGDRDIVWQISPLGYYPVHHSIPMEQGRVPPSMWLDCSCLAEGPSWLHWKCHCHRGWPWWAWSTFSGQAGEHWFESFQSCSALTPGSPSCLLYAQEETGDVWNLSEIVVHHRVAGASTEKSSDTGQVFQVWLGQHAEIDGQSFQGTLQASREITTDQFFNMVR